MTDFDTRAKEWDEVPGRKERALAVADAIRRKVLLTDRMEALEYGCGTGLLSFALQPNLGQILLADSSAGMLEVLQGKIESAGIKNMTPRRLDLSTDPLPASRFDLIYTLMVLHHIPDTLDILQKFNTLLKPRGVLCLADLVKEDGSFHSHDASFSGHNGFNRNELITALVSASFNHTSCEICYRLEKEGKIYPLFLAIAEKA